MIEKMRKTDEGQIKDQAIDSKKSISVINFLFECRRASDSSRIHEGVADWLFREFMKNPRTWYYQDTVEHVAN